LHERASGLAGIAEHSEREAFALEHRQPSPDAWQVSATAFAVVPLTSQTMSDGSLKSHLTLLGRVVSLVADVADCVVANCIWVLKSAGAREKLTIAAEGLYSPRVHVVDQRRRRLNDHLRLGMLADALDRRSADLHRIAEGVPRPQPTTPPQIAGGHQL
jgi:hypothetical protein